MTARTVIVPSIAERSSPRQANGSSGTCSLPPLSPLFPALAESPPFAPVEPIGGAECQPLAIHERTG